MSCQKADCDCADFVASKLISRQFVGRCVNCNHGHDDSHDVAHELACGSNDAVCRVGSHRVFLGNIVAASNAKLLQEHGITHIVCCCPGAFTFASTAGKPLDRERGFERLDLPGFEDSSNSVLSDHVAQSYAFIEQALESSETARVFVHCAQGVSRSTSVVIDWLMRRHNMTYEESLALCKQTRPIAQPNTAFERQLKNHSDEHYWQCFAAVRCCACFRLPLSAPEPLV
jgi:atypical dual specificity phosphatase